jgi:hypothetical protein
MMRKRLIAASGLLIAAFVVGLLLPMAGSNQAVAELCNMGPYRCCQGPFYGASTICGNKFVPYWLEWNGFTSRTHNCCGIWVIRCSDPCAPPIPQQ